MKELDKKSEVIDAIGELMLSRVGFMRDLKMISKTQSFLSEV